MLVVGNDEELWSDEHVHGISHKRLYIILQKYISIFHLKHFSTLVVKKVTKEQQRRGTGFFCAAGAIWHMEE